MNNVLIVTCILGYLLLLFGVAYFAEYKLKKGKSLINNPFVYGLSLCVYCTAWTYYGSVGRATATDGIQFLSIYIGPTLMAMLFYPMLVKIIRITKTLRINSLADFISTRYGKSSTIAAVVSIVCVLGVLPYIALQLKAISVSFDLLINSHNETNIISGSTFYFTLCLILFIIIFGTRSVDATEKHEGLVAAVAFESVIKLVAFIVAGVFVTFYVFNGFGDIFNQAAASPKLKTLFSFSGMHSYTAWFSGICLSMMAVMFLPRQFQVSVIENVKEEHVKKAMWLFPLYLLIINLFVIPIAFGGSILLGNKGIDADTYVLALPLTFRYEFLSIVVFIGGFSAATSMIIVETIALSTMVSNSLVMPLMLSTIKIREQSDKFIHNSLLYVRRLSIVMILLLAYLYDKNVAQDFSLVSIGMISFCGVAQFAPSIIGGIYWKTASKNGALMGIVAGFIIWMYTLIIPSIATAGIIDKSIVTDGLFGVYWLKPHALFGLEGLDSISHAFFWSMLFNCFAYVIVSLYSKLNAQEVYQANIFVDSDKHKDNQLSIWRGTAYIPDLNSLLANFVGKERAASLLSNFAYRNGIRMDQQLTADPRIVGFSERILAGVIGSASARIMVSSVTKEEELSLHEVFKILHESQQMIELNKELRKRSADLTRATKELRAANDQLTTIDEQKDEFLYTVTHELRTPLTSIRSLSEILHDHPELSEEERQQFLEAIVKETERLSHLITTVLSLEKYESGKQKLNYSSFDFSWMVGELTKQYQLLATEKNISISLHQPNSMLLLHADKDMLEQVLVNLLGNALKYTPEGGEIHIVVSDLSNEELQVTVADTGRGIAKELHELIFDKFFQARNQTIRKPEGTGLGLAICKRIVELHKGKIWVESEPEKGARFNFTIPTFDTDKQMIEHNESSL